ncbi:MAG: DUF4492 domain-containing protein [Desulforhopalus sp.]|nr:DUF4492 domain-containing protein [Desulforhopalus sp.]
MSQLSHFFQLPLRVFCFYKDGFRRMKVGKTLWLIIGLKLFIMFAVLRLFFFPDFLGTNFSTDQQRADYVAEQITGTAQE